MIAASGGLHTLVEQPCCINSANGCETGLKCLGKCSYTCMIK